MCIRDSSFSKEYYANDLGWNVNDTHGTGIVMLAAIEMCIRDRYGMTYRKDWADKLGLEKPETVEDIYNMLYACLLYTSRCV